MTYVRVKDKTTGHELSLSDANGPIDTEAYEVLSGKDATDVNGDVLPVVHAETPPAPAERLYGDYETHTAAELKAEVVTRNAEREAGAEHLPTSGNKSKLVETLEADDDASQKETTDA